MVSIMVISYREQFIPMVVENMLRMFVPTYKDNPVMFNEYIVATHFVVEWEAIRTKYKGVLNLKIVPRLSDEIIGVTRNRLLEVSTQYWKFFFDDDDYQFEDRVGKQIAFMMKNNVRISCSKNPVIYDVALKKCIRAKHIKGVTAESSLCLGGNVMKFAERNVYEGSYLDHGYEIGYMEEDVHIMVHHYGNITKRKDMAKGIKNKVVENIINKWLKNEST